MQCNAIARNPPARNGTALLFCVFNKDMTRVRAQPKLGGHLGAVAQQGGTARGIWDGSAALLTVRGRCRCHAISRCWERSSSKLSPRDRTHGQRDERLDVVTRIDIIEDGEGDGGGLEPVGQVGGVNGRGGRSWPRCGYM